MKYLLKTPPMNHDVPKSTKNLPLSRIFRTQLNHEPQWIMTLFRSEKRLGTEERGGEYGLSEQGRGSGRLSPAPCVVRPISLLRTKRPAPGSHSLCASSHTHSRSRPFPAGRPASQSHWHTFLFEWPAAADQMTEDIVRDAITETRKRHVYLMPFWQVFPSCCTVRFGSPRKTLTIFSFIVLK